MNLMLDTGILGQLCHPKNLENKAICEWFQILLKKAEATVYLPELADYELRRKLLHLISKKQAEARSIDRLDALASTYRRPRSRLKSRSAFDIFLPQAGNASTRQPRWKSTASW